MNTRKRFILAAVATVAIFCTSSAPLSLAEAEVTHPTHFANSRSHQAALLQHCGHQQLGRPLSEQCLEAIMRHPLLRLQLRRITALQDGRLSVKELLTNALRARFVRPPQFPDGDPNEIASQEHLEEDGRTLKFLSREEIEALQNAAGFEAIPLHLHPRFGPSELQNWPPIPPPARRAPLGSNLHLSHVAHWVY